MKRSIFVLLTSIAALVFGLVLGVMLAEAAKADPPPPGAVVRSVEPPRKSYFDTATCRDYLSVPINERIQHNRELFRQQLSDPGYIQVQLECAQNPSMLRRMEASIERMCKGREDYLVRNAWTSALNAHKYTCNWR